MIKGIDHIVFTVGSIERSVEFYTRVLGMEHVVFGSGRHAVKFGDQKINLQTLGMETRNRAGVGSADVCLVLSVSIEEATRTLAQHGVDIIEGPVQRSGAAGTITSIYISDPDRNLVELSTY